MDNCCAFAVEDICSGVNTVKCPLDCAFKQTQAERSRKTRAWVARLCKLPDYKQKYISEKYYDGDMPWRAAIIR